MSKAQNISRYYKKKHYDRKIAEKLRDRKFQSIPDRIWENLANRLSQQIPHGYRKATIKMLIGCDVIELSSHLESQFTNGMKLDNYPDWEPDHIKAIANFDLKDLEQQRECFHYSNLKPLWKKDNRSKGSRTQ